MRQREGLQLMRRPGGRVAAAAAGLCVLRLASGVAALAQDRPALQPTRDAAVTYTGMPGPPLHMAWLAARHLSRSDIAPGIWGLFDETARSSLMVNDALKVVLAMPLADPTRLGLRPDARFTRHGSGTVAGQGCTVWGISAQGTEATACITADGVLLRMQALGLTLTATDVTYAPQDPARFQVPAGYREQSVP